MRKTELGLDTSGKVVDDPNHIEHNNENVTNSLHRFEVLRNDI